MGRFINADGYVATGQGVVGNNMYSYCGNNPVSRTDPTCQSWIDIFVIAAGIVVAALAVINIVEEISNRPPVPTQAPTEPVTQAKVPPTKISTSGVEFIAQYEQFAANGYDDGFGNFTIGYGHVIKNGETFGTITEKQALDLLAMDLAGWENAVTNYAATLAVVWDQNQYDAFVSLAVNSGYNFQGVMDSIVSGVNPYDAFCTVINAGGMPQLGLYRRRMDEADMFTIGTYNRTYRDW